MRIVVVEDEAPIREGMAKLLSKKGYDLILVSRNTKEMLLLSQQLSTRCEIITCDLSDENACIKLGRTLAKKDIYILSLIHI